MAKPPQPNFIQRYPWLPMLSGAVLVLWIGFAVFQVQKFHSAQQMGSMTGDLVAQNKPTSGYLQVTGAAPNYAYSQAVGFENDHDKDAGQDYNTYVPYIDLKTKKVVMLVEEDHYSPKDFNDLIDDVSARNVFGMFVDPGSVDPKLWPLFDKLNYHVPNDTPVLVSNGAPDVGAMKGRIIWSGILALLIGGGPWGIVYWISRPKIRRKSFSERYPDRRVY